MLADTQVRNLSPHTQTTYVQHVARIGQAAVAVLLAAAAFGLASVVDNNLLELGALIVAFVAR